MKLKTKQTNIVMLSGDIIKNRNLDLRVLLVISLISNVVDSSKKGKNKRFCSLSKIVNNLNNISDILNMRVTVITKKIKQMADIGVVNGSSINMTKVNLEFTYGEGEFITIPKEIVERLLELRLTNGQLRLYIHLCWLCRDGEKQITDSYLLKCLGLGSSSRTQLQRLTKALEDAELIETRIEYYSTCSKDEFLEQQTKRKKIYSLIKHCAKEELS